MKKQQKQMLRTKETQSLPDSLNSIEITEKLLPNMLTFQKGLYGKTRNGRQERHHLTLLEGFMQ